jgi:FtsP/CotA-like multicopper oxidase with cupredoxin domain
MQYLCLTLVLAGCSDHSKPARPCSDGVECPRGSVCVPETRTCSEAMGPGPDARPSYGGGVDSGPESDATAIGPYRANDEFELTIAEDLDPSPDVIRLEFEARIQDIEFQPGTITPAWTYNGVVPAPLIKAKVGDRLIVDFTNNLPEPTTIHWHGLRVPNSQDGVPNVTQPPVLPGESFQYEFVFNDPGTFWYHPHINTASQVGRGMYGPIVVEDPEDPDFGPTRVIMLSDISIREDGQFIPLDSGGELGTLFGREGNMLLVNGKLNPTLNVQTSSRQRWRVINAARSRYFELRFDGHDFHYIGGDNGLAAESIVVRRPIIVPGQRSDLVVTLVGTPGAESQLDWIPTDRGFGSTYNRYPEPLFKVLFDASPREELPPMPAVSREIELIDTSDAVEIELELTVSQTNGRTLMGINDVPYSEVVPLMAQLGESQIWRLVNRSAFAHPFHIHGYYFQVLDDNGVPVLPLEWKDTVDVPVDHTVRIAIKFEDRPGTWMYHCHILDHAGAGMMGQLIVTE